MNRPVASDPAVGVIQLRGVRVNNLKDVDLDIPHGQLLTFCGLSGSGKTSLALDTLFAEGQRRYIECFSPYTRQFLHQLEKPEADEIQGIPPAIAVTASRKSGNARTTVGTVTEVIEFLRLLFARTAELVCPDCQRAVTCNSPQDVTSELAEIQEGRRLQIAFPVSWQSAGERESVLSDLRRNGFRRVIFQGSSGEVDGLIGDSDTSDEAAELQVVVDRLKTSSDLPSRCTESLETAYFYGHGHAAVLLELPAGAKSDAAQTIDGRLWERRGYCNHLICGNCQRGFSEPEAALFSFNSPHGACPECEGFGSVHYIDMDKIVPDPSKTLREGAIVPWKSPAYQHELDELIAIADQHDLPLDVPFSEMGKEHLDLIWQGDRANDFGGLNGFFRWLEKRKYKMHLRIFLARWRSWRDCPQCHGRRLNDTALAWQIDGRNIAELSATSIDELIQCLEAGESASDDRAQTQLVHQITDRLRYLQQVGVGYLTLDRPLRTLSAGEQQRVALTRALGSTLVNLLYVIDEPSAGLHPHDVQKLKPQICELHDRRNTVVIVDHDPEIITMSQRVVELGPSAGRAGGEIVFDGSPGDLAAQATTPTGQFLAGKRGFSYSAERRRDASRSKIKLFGARTNNLKNIDAEFPLGVLCVVTGVSGSGKSSLVRQTLAPAIEMELRSGSPTRPDCDQVLGAGKIDQIAVIDQTALGKISRSNPATYVKAFDEIRKVFAGTVDAKTRSLKPGHFSFNVEGGRCEHCNGEGYLTIDMQFMADVLRKCEQCGGTRFKSSIREVRYRNRNIAEVLEMTVDDGFAFFRGHKRVQTRLKLLKDVGLGYVQLGQPVSTLSTGEAQRLKLAAFLGAGGAKRTLFIMDEPTSGLHMADVVRLIDCFDALIDVGHSLIVIEHHLLMMAHADHIIDVGPGAADAGGRIIATGTPEEISENDESVTGRYLAQLIQQATA